jgi:hypothetical protein
LKPPLIACLACVIIIAAAFAAEAPKPSAAISLAGEWAFRLDHDGVGIERHWYDAPLPDVVKLPGSTDENHWGKPNHRKPDFNHLARLYEYTGPAWYQREVAIPPAWRGKRVTLFLERCHWETSVWVDSETLGMRDSLCVPHVYDLTKALTPGKHRLTIRIDNTIKYDVGGWAHSITEETQTNWNGVLGRIELRASDPVWIDDLQVYPDVAAKTVKVRAALGNATGKPAKGELTLRALPTAKGVATTPRSFPFAADGDRAGIEVTYPMGADVALWDEFSPALYNLEASLSAAGFSDSRTVRFGMRNLGISGKYFTCNGRRIYLRGTLECCIFPLTGYPPTTVELWLRIMTIARSYGLNHLRFHSWCPPEAAFAAADQMGFLFHVEAPQWAFNVGQDPPRDDFVRQEVLRILAAYGNHPSFGMLCMGNELGGDASFLQTLVKLGQATDPRHFYTPATAWSFGAADDYNVAVVRGLHGPGTDADFRDPVAASRVPVISHEVGQWTVFPNLDEIARYTGVLRARNFEIVRDDLAARHMLDQAPAFTRASGHLAVELYKEEIEVLRRTPGHAGFQLLDLHDFPGQGTALIGILDPFWESKGLLAPEAFRRFCGPTAPLLRVKKRVFTSDETFTADAEIAHFGPADIPNAAPVWSIADPSGRVVASGVLPQRDLPTGNLLPLGKIETSLAAAPAPTRLTVTVALKGTDIANDWNLWVYPPAVSIEPPPDVLVVRAYDAQATEALAAGKKVFLLGGPGILARSMPGGFLPPFWTPTWSASPASMSLLCDPKHPALARFPTDAYTNWQWYDLLTRSRSVILDDAPPAYRPIVQVIDAFNRNHKLGNVFEARVGPGRLLVCSINLWSDIARRPAARQLLHSLLAYAASDAFRPTQELDSATLATLFRAESPLHISAEPPKDLDRAVLRVKASPNVPKPNTPEPWRPEADEVLARQDGFGYSVQAGTWRDETGSAWHSGDNLVVTLTCPRGFVGTLYAHFHDWNNLERVAEIFFGDQDLGELSDCQQGVWVAVKVTARDSAEGKLVLSARPSHANVMITQIALVK